MISLLVVSRFCIDTRSSVAIKPNGKCKLLYRIFFWALAGILLVPAFGCQKRFDSDATADAIHVDPNPIDLGVLNQGQSARKKFILRNLGNTPVVISEIKSSCPCLKIEGCPVMLPKNAIQILEISFDPTEEPNFVGSLMIDLVGFDAIGSRLFSFQASIQVTGNRN